MGRRASLAARGVARAAELDPDERARLLETEEENIRREVERLLAEHEASGVLDLPAAADDRWTGRILNGRYRIERFLARGGAGAVYLARDEPIAGRAVVIKFLEHRDAWLESKFHQEMEALARIDHPGVVGILDAGATGDGLPFLVIEFIDGVTLRYEIQNGPVQPARAARLIRQIGGAVSAEPEKGVLHRDLKPENIMLERPGTPEEIVRLIDFGIARLDRPEEQAPTRTTRFAGTTPYMAPEQLAGRPQAASDIYALGVSAYEMLSGRRPFAAASPVELYEQQRAGIKRGAIPGVAPAAVRAILKQLSFRPENRAGSRRQAVRRMVPAEDCRGPGKRRGRFRRGRLLSLAAFPPARLLRASDRGPHGQRNPRAWLPKKSGHRFPSAAKRRRHNDRFDPRFKRRPGGIFSSPQRGAGARSPPSRLDPDRRSRPGTGTDLLGAR